MFDLTLTTAKVINIDDKDKKGKIQINIKSVMKNYKTELYPWAIPLFSKTSDSTMSMNLPKLNSQVWVLVDKFYKRFYYLTNRYFYNLFDFSKVSGILDKCEKIGKEYKDLIFTYFEDKSLIFHNNFDGSTGIINCNGTIIYINKDGDFIRNINKDEISEINGDKKETIKGNKSSKINGDYDISIDGKNSLSAKSINYISNSSITLKSTSTELVDIGNKMSTLGSILSEICQDLASLKIISTVGTCTTELIANMNILLTKIKRTFK